MSETYTITRITIAHATIEAENEEEIIKLYHEGVVDESLSSDNHKDLTTKIKNEKGKVIHEHQELGR